MTDFYYVTSEEEMEAHVLNYGPLSVAVAASTWWTYTGGVLSTCSTGVDHGVQVVGVDRDEGYWTVILLWFAPCTLCFGLCLYLASSGLSLVHL